MQRLAMGHMGMSPAEFWSMPPRVFSLKVDGYLQRENKAGVYFRELFALLYNVNRGEKQEALKGADVLRLSGEKKKRPEPAYVPIIFRMSPQDLNDYMRRMGASVPQPVPNHHDGPP